MRAFAGNAIVKGFPRIQVLSCGSWCSLRAFGDEFSPQDNEKEMISALLAFRARLDVVVSNACDGNESYHYKLKEAWETFLNARYVARLLRRS